MRISPLDRKDSEAADQRLGKRAVTAAQWRIASMAFQIVVAFPVGILLARLLLPADFGLAALSLVVTGFVTLAADLGLGSAIIQRRELNERHLRVALTGSFLLGVSIAGLVVLAAPLISRAAGNPGLVALLRLQSLIFITAGCGIVAASALQRRLDFRRLFFVDVTSYTFGYALVAIIGALSGLGVWSLVLGNLVQGTIFCMLSVKAANTPLRPLLARRELGELLGFGIGVSANALVAYVGRSGDNFFVGRLLGTTVLGYYSRAFNLMMMPINYVTSVIFNILVPTFAEIQHERARIGRGLVLSVQLAAIIVLPVAAGMIVAAPHLILGLYGDRWAGAIRPLQVLCLAALPRAIHPLAGAVNRACNRVGTEVWLQCGFAAAVVGAAIVGSHNGIVGVAALVSVAIVLMLVCMAALALHLTGSTWRAFLGAQLPGALIGLLSASIAVALRATLERAGWSHLPILSALVLAGAISIPLGVYLLPARVRPTELFSRLTPPLRRLPAPLRASALFILRMST
jgi:O-antigen/teichoic acid export membrane protein